jgi:hypothetical protein
MLMGEYQGYIALVPRDAELETRLRSFLLQAAAVMVAALGQEEVWYVDQPQLPDVGHKLVFVAFGVEHTAYQYVTLNSDYIVLAVRYSQRYLAPGGGFTVDRARLRGAEVVALNERPVEEQVTAFLAARR